MRIVFLGHLPFLSALLNHLKESPFLTRNEINICFCPEPQKRLGLFEYFKKINWEEWIRAKDDYFYKEQIEALQNRLFPIHDISFLEAYPNAKIRAGLGIRGPQDLENADCLIICPFSGMISREILCRPGYCSIQLYASAIPFPADPYPCYTEAYRQSHESAISIRQMSHQQDSGKVIMTRNFSIDPLAPTHEREMECARHGAAILNEWQNSGFSLISKKEEDRQVDNDSPAPELKRSIGRMNGMESLEAYVRANYSRHLFPFTHCIYRFSTFSILKLRRADQPLPPEFQHVEKQIIRHGDKFFIRFNGVDFEIPRYFYRGMLVGDDNPKFHEAVLD